MTERKNGFVKVLKICLSACGKAGAYLWQRCRHNWGLKLISLIFSVIICSMLINQSNPDRRITLTEIPVLYEDLTTLESSNLTLSEASRTHVATVNVSLNVPMEDVSKVTSDTVTAWASLAAVRDAGEQEIRIRVTTELGSVSWQSEEKLKINVERRVSKTVSVEVETVGSMPEGYTVSNTTVAPSVVTVTGAESAVAAVSKGVVYVDVDAMTQSFSGSESFVLVDSSGALLDTSHLTLSTTGVIMSATVRKSVSLPVNAALSLTGAELLPEGYELTNIEVIPSTVTVSGTEKNLADVVELTCDTIDIAGLSDNRTFTVSLRPISGLIFQANSVEVTVHISPKIITRTLENINVEVTNVGPSVMMPKPVEPVGITVTGPEHIVGKMNAQSFKVSINARNLEAGTHLIRPSIALDEAFEGQLETGSLTVSPDRITLVLEPVETETEGEMVEP